jgi:selenide,water dikinase
VLGKLARQQDANVLVGFDKADDAGVYQIAPDTALVQTVDFFTPWWTILTPSGKSPPSTP